MYWINDSSLSLSAMQKKVVMNEVRTPTSHWSGLGFSKSMPESAIKELVSNSTYTDSINLFSFENELGYFDQYSLVLFTVVRWSRNIEFRAFTAPTLIQIFIVSRHSVPFARVEVKFRACNRFHACFILELVMFHHGKCGSFDSSVGRAEDCRVCYDILRSLVQIRLEGGFFQYYFLLYFLYNNFGH